MRDFRETPDVLETKEDNIIQGYATKYEPYHLATIDGIDYFEQIERDAFNETDFSDVIMQYDHTGAVMARNSNQSLQLEVDDIGLKVTADLSKSQKGRDLYESIKNELTTKMSFAFTVAEEEFIKETRTRMIKKIKKVYDISAVSRPQNPDTELSARSFVEGVIEKRDMELWNRTKIEYIYNLNLAKGIENIDRN